MKHCRNEPTENRTNCYKCEICRHHVVATLLSSPQPNAYHMWVATLWGEGKSFAQFQWVKARQGERSLHLNNNHSHFPNKTWLKLESFGCQNLEWCFKVSKCHRKTIKHRVVFMFELTELISCESKPKGRLY